MRKKVYLAGPIFKVEDPATWRSAVATALAVNWEAVDPIALEASIEEPDKLVATDLRAIRQCHAMFARVDVPSWGTAMEIFFAASIGIPVIGWRPGSDGPDSPWLKHHTREIYRSFAEAVVQVGMIK
jgi:nucleoside 2-deoxyribosyltransferase